MPTYDRFRPTSDYSPNNRIGYEAPKLPEMKPDNFVDRILTIIADNLEKIPVLGVLVKVLRAILDTNQDGQINFDDLLGLFTGRGLIGAVINGVLGGLRITPNMISSGDSDNLLVSAGFDVASSMREDENWKWDGSIGHTAYPLGSARATANGTRLVQLSQDVVRVDAGQKLPISAWARWAGVTSGTGPAITVEAQFYKGATPTEIVTVSTVDAPSGSGGWRELAGTIVVPQGSDGMRLRLAVEATVTAGRVWFDDASVRKTGTMPQDRVTGLPDAIAGLVGNFLGIGNSIVGFLTGKGKPATGTSSDPIADWVQDALGAFTGQTNTTSTTADKAQGVGSNALTNTVSIEARLRDVVEQQESAVTARSLWETMDYTADPTFALYLMMRSTAHVHQAATVHNLGTNSQGGNERIDISGTTDSGNGGGGSHTHGFSSSDSFSWSHVHTVTGSITTTVTSANSEYLAYTFGSDQAYMGFIRCRSVQEKRVFSFRPYFTAAITDFRLDIYLLSKSTGTLTKVHTSANLAGAVTGVAQWVQYVIPTGTAGIKVEPGDIIGVQFSIASGTLALQGLDSLIPSNPAGYLPRRIGMLRSGVVANRAPATMAESLWSAGAGFIPYVEAGVDTGQASAPITITDNFDGSLSELWLMTGVNEIAIASNNIGIRQSGIELTTGWVWGKFNTQLRTDSAEVGLAVTATSDEEQVVWFKGNGPNLHVGLAISSSYAVLYTMSGGVRTNRTQVAISTVDADYRVRYTESSKVFTIYRNNVQIGTWTDSGNVAPSGLGNRFGGVGLHATRGPWFGIGSTKASPIDNWLLADL